MLERESLDHYKTMSDIQKYNKEIVAELANQGVKQALLATTFKGLSETSMRKAALEGMIRGFTFKDFLEKNVYAIPFKEGYSLITSIDYIRKVAMRSGMCGKTKPEFQEGDNGKVISCTITVKRKIEDYIGEYSATVYFDEYTTTKNLWATKPRTMIAKVAEMHALRSAFPEQMAQQFIEEEMQKSIADETIIVEPVIDTAMQKLDRAQTFDELQEIYRGLSADERKNTEIRGYATNLKVERFGIVEVK